MKLRFAYILYIYVRHNTTLNNTILRERYNIFRLKKERQIPIPTFLNKNSAPIKGAFLFVIYK